MTSIQLLAKHTYFLFCIRAGQELNAAWLEAKRAFNPKATTTGLGLNTRLASDRAVIDYRPARIPAGKQRYLCHQITSCHAIFKRFNPLLGINKICMSENIQQINLKKRVFIYFRFKSCENKNTSQTDVSICCHIRFVFSNFFLFFFLILFIVYHLVFTGVQYMFSYIYLEPILITYQGILQGLPCRKR